MPLTKIKRGGLDTGITDNSDANALTFDSSENATFVGSTTIDGVAKISEAGSGNVLLETTQSSKYLQLKSNEGIYFQTNSANYNYIDSSNNFIKTSGHMRLDSDSHKFTAGAGQDFQFYHDGSNSRINNTTGHIIINQGHSSGNTEFEIQGSGNYTFAGGDLIVNGYGIESVKNGSDSATSGSYLRCKTASGDLNVWMWQLGASNTFDLWNYNAGGDNAWEKACRFTTTNLNATFYGSEITLGNGTAAQSNKLTTGDGIYASTNYDPDQYYLAWNYSNKGGTESVGVSSRASWIWKGVTSTSGNYLELRHRAGNAAAGTQNSVLKFTSSQNAEFAGNVGIGVSPSSTNTSHDSLNIGGNGYWASYGTQGAGGEMDIGHNFYYAQSGNNTYISTDEATRYRQGAGMHTFSTAASGSAGGTVTFSDVLTLNANSSATFAFLRLGLPR